MIESQKGQWVSPVWLYAANTILIIVHEVDSAYWREWSLLGLPGGIQFFLLLHLPILAIVMWGFRQVVLWRRGAKALSYLLAGAGITAFTIHMTLMARGYPEFRQPVSQGILWSTFLVSLVQAAVVWRCPMPERSQPSV